MPDPPTTHTADSVDRADVSAAYDLCSAGDTLAIPAGSATWTSELVVAKAITVQGAGIGSTIITNSQGTGSGTPATGAYMTFNVYVPGSGTLRFTGLEIQMGNTAQGILAYGTQWGQLRIDNCHFEKAKGRAIRIGSLLRVLIHDCVYEDNFKSIDNYPYAQRNWSWQNALTLGTEYCTVIEDNEFNYYTNTPTVIGSHEHGARTCWRYNAYANYNPSASSYPILDAHGNQATVASDNTGTNRATRQVEYYSNTHDCDVGGGFSAVQIRGGTFLAYDNTYTGSKTPTGFQFREEDGPNFRNLINPAAYPGYDMHWAWMWSNYSNGGAMSWYNYDTYTDVFVIEDTNLFMHAPQSGDPSVYPGLQKATPLDAVYPYNPLAYPHPWRDGTPPVDPGGGGTTNARRRMLAMLLSR